MSRCYPRSRRRSYPLPPCTLRVFHSRPSSTFSCRSSVGIPIRVQNRRCEPSCSFRTSPSEASDNDPQYLTHRTHHLAKRRSEFVASKKSKLRWDEPRTKGDTRSIRMKSEMVGRREPNVGTWTSGSRGVEGQEKTDVKEVKSKQNRCRSGGSRELGVLRFGSLSG